MEKNYWTKKRCLAEALKYPTRMEWCKKSGGSYQFARRNKLLNYCSRHMLELRKPKGYWTKKNCQIEANKYGSRTEWSRNDSASHGAAVFHGWLDECCNHMKRPSSGAKRMIYVFFDDNKKYAYVGLSSQLVRRFNTHLGQRKEFIESLNKGDLVFVCDFFLHDQSYAQQLEAELMELFSKNYRLLNRAPAGSLGGNVVKWDLKSCKEDAKKYKNRSEWSDNNVGSYQAASRRGWLEECCPHMINLREKRTKKDCIKVGRQFKTKSQWVFSDFRKVYDYAHIKGWLEECCSHMIKTRSQNKSQTFNSCNQDALRYKSRIEWQKKSSGPYQFALKNGWVDKCCSHMAKIKGKWNKENIWECVYGCKNISGFEKSHSGAQKAAVRLGIIKNIKEHFNNKKTLYRTQLLASPQECDINESFIS